MKAMFGKKPKKVLSSLKSSKTTSPIYQHHHHLQLMLALQSQFPLLHTSMQTTLILQHFSVIFGLNLHFCTLPQEILPFTCLDQYMSNIITITECTTKLKEVNFLFVFPMYIMYSTTYAQHNYAENNTAMTYYQLLGL